MSYQVTPAASGGGHPGFFQAGLPLPVKAGVVGLLVALAGALMLAPDWTMRGMFALTLGVPALVLAWRYPELGLVALVFFGSNIIDPNAVDVRLPIGGGLQLPDLLLLLLNIMAVFRLLQKHELRLPDSVVAPPILILLGLSAFSALYATLYLNVDVIWSFSELRGLAYYTVFLLVILEVRRREQIKRLLAGLAAVGLLTAVLMVMQQFLGAVPLVSGQLASTWQIIEQGGGAATRIRPPAHILVYFLSIVAFAWLGYLRDWRLKVAALVVVVVLNLLLLLTFTRIQWVASAVAMVVCLALFPKEAKLSLGLTSLGLVLVCGVVFPGLAARWSAFSEEENFASPVLLRAQSIFQVDETLESDSAQSRIFQTSSALAALRANPVLGVGLGSSYRGMTALEAQTRYTRLTRFVENSYLYLATKMGIPGLLAGLWLLAAIMATTLTSFASASERFVKANALACLAAFTGLLVWAFLHPIFMLPEHTVSVSLIAGLGEALRKAKA